MIREAAVCLHLVLDASGSVDAAEHALQRDATAAAISSPEFIARAQHEGGVALAASEFSGGFTPLIDWVVVRDAPTAIVFAEALRAAPRVESGSTAVGDALIAAVVAFERAPLCERRVVDVSTDGRSNTGAMVEEGVAFASAKGVTVNALVIEDEPGLLDYYRDAVNGFALPAEWATYEQSLKMKITLEIANAPRAVEPELPRYAYEPPYARLGYDRGAFGPAPYGVASAQSQLVEVYVRDDARRLLDLSNDIRQRVPAPGTGGLLSLAAGFLMVSAACLRRR